MLKIILNTVAKPLLERLGTSAATAIVVGGEMACTNFGACGLVTEVGAGQVVSWTLAALFVGIDLVLADRRQKKTAARAIDDMIARNGG